MTDEQAREQCDSHRAATGRCPAPQVDVTEYWCEKSCLVYPTCPLLNCGMGAQQAKAGIAC
jgi:hypothetical protein